MKYPRSSPLPFSTVPQKKCLQTCSPKHLQDSLWLHIKQGWGLWSESWEVPHQGGVLHLIVHVDSAPSSASRELGVLPLNSPWSIWYIGIFSWFVLFILLLRTMFVATLYMLCYCLFWLVYRLDVLVATIIIDSSTPLHTCVAQSVLQSLNCCV